MRENRHLCSELPEAYDILAPDGSEIRLLKDVESGSMVHCVLPPGHTSIAVRHQTVEEIWHFLSGIGEVWRKLSDAEIVDKVTAGTSLTIPLGAHFQFRNTGEVPLAFIIATMPPWPGNGEAILVADYWPR